ncbi:hypothetical protein JCM31826_12730 [Thermaurantimonas aggregans]|uniref:Uncharacterized protein n=1 Tax=Thermaurantimonas aggregans TaxID=2173829 RepID=A0A401XLC8_9FLAO|nr:DUF6607 family protein [Thermaurantimonas aggregans]MCX8148285.1 hypothetical protein [Thermaurantimonas aggregans]GCD77791.1 hypothetical protein JCM31826_12730 [Thermaurantimonas aggregans]
MKKFAFISIIFAMAHSALIAQKARERSAIKAMCGCYEVEFLFAETFVHSEHEGYQSSGVYKEKGLEWVVAVEDKPGKIVLQHLLIMDDTTIVKHWRQDWLYQNTELLDYIGNDTWQKLRITPKNAKGTWTQRVFQVDDSPRYEGYGTWVFVDGKTYWESAANSPLPRREFTKRSDYNILKRNNRHEITPDGWVHLQDNKKIARQNNVNQLIAEEKGVNIYRKVDDSRCFAAQKWWASNQQYWNTVRFIWDEELRRRELVILKRDSEGKPSFVTINALDPTSPQSEVRSAILQFLGE